MQGLLNVMRLHASMMLEGRAATRLGTVSSYDPRVNGYCAKVMIQPDGFETGWLPIATHWVGNGWGLFSPPSIGDMVEVQFQEDNFEVGMICGRFFNDEDQALAVESGEWWLIHKTGSFIKLTNDGKLSVNGQVEIDATAPTINITATGNVTVIAGSAANVTAQNVSVTASNTVSVTGTSAVNVTSSTSIGVQAPSIHFGANGQTLHALITDALVDLYNGHTHNDPQGGATDVPNQLMDSGQLTTTIQGA